MAERCAMPTSATQNAAINQKATIRWRMKWSPPAELSPDSSMAPYPSRDIPPRENRVPSAPMYTETFAQFKKQLGQLDKWLGMAADYAKSKNFDPEVFPT